MKRVFGIVILALITGSLAWASVAASLPGKSAPLRVFASKAIANRVDRIANKYHDENPAQPIVVTGGLISKGFPLFCKGHVDLAISSRLMNERESAMARESDCKLSHRQCAGFMVAVITHPDNPLKEISLLDLAKIYAGEISNWKEIGGADEPIHVLGRHYPMEGIAVAFTETVMAGKPLDSLISLRDYDRSMVMSVSGIKGSIGYARSDAVKSNMVKTLALKEAGSDQPALPIPSDLKRGAYPIVAKLTAYWNDRSQQAALAEAFAAYCCGSLMDTPNSR